MKTFAVKSSATQLLSKARALTGISDIIDTDIEEVLERFLHALNTEAQLNERGAEAMERHILLLLCNRLRMLRDFQQHPEINDQQIVRPLILTGGARTGSTKLHKMLAAGGDFNRLLCWQGINLPLRTGQRDEDPGERIREADEHVRWFNDHAPQARLIHEFSTFEPEEESLILAHLLFGPYMPAFVFVPDYVQWYVTNRDLHADFEFLKRGLKYLQWQFQEDKPRRWLLKNPIYPGFEPLIAQVFPDATFVTTNRDPVSSLSSACSLLDYYHKAYSDVERRHMIGAMLQEGLAAQIDQQIAGRDGHPELRFLDVAYTELTRRAEQVVEKVYAHAGMPLSDKARLAMRDWEQENQQYKLGVHRYSLESFGLTQESVREKYGRYIARWNSCF